jgi:hypothetical protein
VSSTLVVVLLIAAVLFTAYQRRHTLRYALIGSIGEFYPDGFKPTHKRRRMAIDMVSKRLWLRDEADRSVLLSKEEIVAAEVVSRGGQNRMTGQQGHHNTKVLVKTARVDTPLLTVPFNAAGDSTIMGGNRNYEEAVAWVARIDALIRS